MPNYDASQPATPYVWVPKLYLHFPTGNLMPWVEVRQSLAIKSNGGVSYGIESSLPYCIQTLDYEDVTPIPLIDLNSGAPLGGTTTVQDAMLALFAVVRKVQTGDYVFQPEPQQTPLPPEVP